MADVEDLLTKKVDALIIGQISAAIRAPLAEKAAKTGIPVVLLVRAGGGAGNAMAQASNEADPMEGVWESVVTARNCTTGEAVGTFRGAQVSHRGGTLSDTNASPPTTQILRPTCQRASTDAGAEVPGVRTAAHSHSIVAGGLLLTSYVTRLMPRTSLMMRLLTFFNSA